MKILAIIPARGGSKGVPNKNRKLLGGKPLLQYSIEAALACAKFSDIIVSTDDAEIAELAQAAGANVPFLRPVHLATDSSPTIDTVIHAVQFFAQQGTTFDAICLLQPTVPFRQVADVQNAIETFSTSAADSLISVRKVAHQFNPHWVFEAKKGSDFLKIATGEKEIISRRQELPAAYYRDGSIYLVRTEILLKKRSLYGNKIAFHLSTNSQYVNIDTLEDWNKAEIIIKRSSTP